MRRRLLHAAALTGAIAIGATLYAWGQPPISTSGSLQLWVGSIYSGENSQQVADWYTLSHVVHGLLIVLLGRLLPFLGWGLLYLLAIVTGTAWEIVEHTDWVLDQFRGTTLYQGYRGDSVLNAVADYVFMLSGFLLASLLRTGWVLAAVAVLEITAAVVARDCLTLTTLMLVYPIDAVEAWQQEVNPLRPPAE